jgi:Luciferase-like monooxygenase
MAGRCGPTPDTFDPFVALSAAPAVISRIKLGTGVCLVTERDPIVLAKEVASLDRLMAGNWRLPSTTFHGFLRREMGQINPCCRQDR